MQSLCHLYCSLIFKIYRYRVLKLLLLPTFLEKITSREGPSFFSRWWSFLLPLTDYSNSELNHYACLPNPQGMQVSQTLTGSNIKVTFFPELMQHPLQPMCRSYPIQNHNYYIWYQCSCNWSSYGCTSDHSPIKWSQIYMHSWDILKRSLFQS